MKVEVYQRNGLSNGYVRVYEADGYADNLTREDFFAAFNNGSGSEDAGYFAYCNRSMSIGDVLRTIGSDGDRWWGCSDGAGWIEIEPFKHAGYVGRVVAVNGLPVGGGAVRDSVAFDHIGDAARWVRSISQTNLSRGINVDALASRVLEFRQ